MNTKNLIAEFIGTFALIFIGAGALAIGEGGLVGVALAHGLVIVVFAYAYGHISGTHINPAVTLGLLIAGEIQFVAAVGYWVVQFLGGILGAVLLNVLLPNPGDLGVTILSENVGVGQGLVVEIVLTFFLVNTIFNTAVSGRRSGCQWKSRKLRRARYRADPGTLHPNGRTVDAGISQSSAHIGTCHCQWQLRRHLALLCRTVSRCNPRSTSLHRCSKGPRRGVGNTSQAKRKAGTFTCQPFHLLQIVLRCGDRNFCRFRGFCLRNRERQHTICVSCFDVRGLNVPR